jgi:hypothetical protein
MSVAHDVRGVSVAGCRMQIQVDGVIYHIDLAKESQRLARATQEQREKVEVSPAGYGLHWPDVDEDLSIDGLIGVQHPSRLVAVRR